jgi:hypothetical protein
MELKKCRRCGCFHTSLNNLCNACIAKDDNDINKLKNYLDTYSKFDSIQSISVDTGISSKNITRYLDDNVVDIPLSKLK